jgi:transcriptional coactivator HFI1/ADA1
MPDLDSSLSRSAAGAQAVSAAKPAVAAAAAANGTPAQKPAKTVPTAARADYEPIYMGLKAAVGENWARYKDATSKYLLGALLSTFYYLFQFSPSRG